jgi:hypothetical protein
MSASSIRPALGENAPSLPGIIDKMGQDDRFHSNDEKRWSLATEDVEDTESGPKKKTSRHWPDNNGEPGNRRTAHAAMAKRTRTGQETIPGR